MAMNSDGYCQAWKAGGGGRCTRRAKDHPLFCAQHAEPIKWLDPLVAHEFTWLGRATHRSPATRDMTVEVDRMELGAAVAYALDLEWYDATEQLSRVFDSIEAVKRAVAWERDKAERQRKDVERRAFIDSELAWAHEHDLIWVRTFSHQRNEAGGVRHMTRFISPRRRYAETLCGLSVTVQRCTYDEIFKVATCSQCQHAFRMEQAGLPIPEHPIEALKRPETAARLVAANRYPRQSGDTMPAFEISQFFHKKVAQAVEYLEKVGGTVEDPKSAATKLGRDSGIGEHIAGAVVGHLLGMNMVAVERTAKPRSHDIVTKITLNPESEWLDEKPDYTQILLDTLRDSGGIGDLKGGKAVRMLTEVAGVPFGVAHVRHLLADLEAEDRVHREVIGRRTLWIGLPDQEIPEEITAKVTAHRAGKAQPADDDTGEEDKELTPAQPVKRAEAEPTAGDLARNVLGHKLGPWHQEHRLTAEKCQEAMDAYAAAGSYVGAGKELGISEKGVRLRVKVGQERFGLKFEGLARTKQLLGEVAQLTHDQPVRATPEEVAQLTDADIRPVNVPDTAAVVEVAEPEDIDYDQLADAMLNRVGLYLANRDEVILGQETLIAELRQSGGNREEIEELAKLLTKSAETNEALKAELAEAQRNVANLERHNKHLATKLDEVHAELAAARAKPTKTAAQVSDEAKRSVMGVAKDFLRGPKSP